MAFRGAIIGRPGVVEVGMVAAAALTAALIGFHTPLSGPLEDLLDLFGIGFSLAGFLVGALVRGPSNEASREASLARTSGWCLLATGLSIILGQLLLAAVFGVLSLTLGAMAVVRGPNPLRSPAWLPAFSRLFHEHGPAFCRFALLVLLLETWETYRTTRSSPAQMAEIGLFALLAALAALGWAAGSHGKPLQDEATTRNAGHAGGPARWMWSAAILLLLFACLAAVLYVAPIRALDGQVGRELYHAGSRSMTRLMRKISDSGGRDLTIYWIPLWLLATRLTRGPRALTFLAAAMFGTVGLELFFKGLLGRMRPEYTHGAHFDSFPSGHTLAATILAGALLVIYLPACRYGWQRAVLWVAAVGWPVLMGTTRIYLGRHYFTDVLGGLLLGAAWVLFAAGTFRLLARQIGNEAPSEEASASNSPTRLSPAAHPSTAPPQ